MQAVTCTIGDVQRRSSLESLFCYDKSIREEVIEKPIGLALAEKFVGDHPRCPSCLAKGANLCTTCAGSGLYVDSILESQGIIVKVKCLGNVRYYLEKSFFQICATFSDARGMISSLQLIHV